MTTIPNLNPIPAVTGDDYLITHDITTNRSGRVSAQAIKDFTNIYNSTTIEAQLDKSTRIIPNITTLASTSGNAGDRIYLLCHTTAGYGGGYFTAQAVGSLANDGGTIVVNGAIAWVRDYARLVTPEMFGAVGDGTTVDTAALLSCIQSKKPVWLTPGRVYLTGRLGVISAQDLVITSSPINKGKILLQSNVYTGNSNAWLEWSESNYNVHLENISIDQNWTNTTYPAGFSQNDGQLASTWGGNGWLMKLSSNQQARVSIIGCDIDNCFRGILASSFNRVVFKNNNSVSMAGLCHCIISTELSTSVVYTGNYLKTRDWFNYPGFTGDDGLHGNKCRNVLISDNHLIGHQLVFHAYPESGSADGMGSRLKVVNNTIEYPPADTAFYRWKELVVSSNSIYFSGDMGIAISSSSYATVTGNVIKGVHVGGIGITDCTQVTITGNVITDWAQGYDAIETLGGRYTSGAGLWKAGIVCDYQSGGQKGVNCTITGNTLAFDNLPPVTDGGPSNGGVVRATTLGIYVDITSNPASQSSMCITGNFLNGVDAATLPMCRIFAPTHRCYISGKTGTPIQFETFIGPTGSFRYLADFGTNSLLFLDKLQGLPGASITYAAPVSGATLTIHGTPQFVSTNCLVANNYTFDFTDTKEDKKSTHLYGSSVVDPTSIAVGTELGFTITVTGAAVGDFSLVAPPYQIQGLAMTHYVSNTNEITVVLRNGTAGAIDLASGTWKGRVIKAYE
jgi:hypothetical protein